MPINLELRSSGLPDFQIQRPCLRGEWQLCALNPARFAPGGFTPPERKFRKDKRVEIQECWCARNDYAASPHAIFFSENIFFLRSRRVYPNFFTRGASPRGSEKYWTLQP